MPSSLKNKLLNQIELSISSQIMINKNDHRKLIAHEEWEGEPLIAQIFFVGISHQHGIKKEDVTDYLCIEEAIYESRLKAFLRRLEQYYYNDDETEKTKRFITRLSLVNRSLRNTPNDYVKLA